MKISIKVTDDKTCSVWSSSCWGEGSIINGLTPERAVEVKNSLENAYRLGFADAKQRVFAALQKVEIQPE